jgi:hypothetical protein
LPPKDDPQQMHYRHDEKERGGDPDIRVLGQSVCPSASSANSMSRRFLKDGLDIERDLPRPVAAVAQRLELAQNVEGIDFADIISTRLTLDASQSSTGLTWCSEMGHRS